MSREVDERVVSMQFDNKKFEANVATTMSTLDKLENKLNFKGAGKALDELNASANKLDLSHMGNAVESIEVKFSAMSIAAIAAINRIVNRAFDAGEQLIKSLSIDQITAGWEKYGEKTTAVQTIMAATGDSIDEVNKQLEKMNWFTDETSFNFTDMTNNVGKFTSAGVDLDKAVLAMQGIAAEAALSGQNAQSASRAMYNFSQALGTGAVKVQDWMSIENANMATKEFKETIIETAKELGRVSETGEILAITSSKYSGDEFVDFTNFRNTLAAGWFDSDVLIKSLEKYGAFATKLQEITDATGTTATEMLRYVREYESGATDIGKISRITGVSVEELSGYMETLTAKEYELGRKAFQAAQEAKTLREAIDATKDAVSTGWMNTFELLFGNYEEAKILWTKLSEDLWGIFASGGENRNELLSEWKEMFDGRTMLVESLSTAMDRLIEIIGLVRDAFSNVFPPMTAQRLADITKNFRDLVLSIKIFEDDEETLTGTGKTIYTVFHSLAEVVSVLATALGTLGSIAKGILGAFGDAVKEVFEPLSDDLLTNATTKLKKFIKSLKPGENAFKNLSKIFKIMLTPAKGLLDIFGSLGDKVLSIIPSTEKVGTVFERVFGSERYAKITDGFGKIIDKISGLLQKLFDKISGLFKKNEFGEDSPLSKFLSNIYAILEPIASWMLDKIVEGVESLAALDWDSILGSIEENLGKIYTKITNIIQSVKDFFNGSKNGLNGGIMELGSVGDTLLGLQTDLKTFKTENTLLGALTSFKTNALTGVGESFTKIGTSIGEFVSNIDPAKVAVIGFGTALTAAFGAATATLTAAKGVFTGFSGVLTQIKTNIAASKPKQYERIAVALVMLAGALAVLALVKPDGLKQATISMLEIMGAFTAMVGAFAAIEKFLIKSPEMMVNFNLMGKAMESMATGVLILVAALWLLTKIELEGIGERLLILVGLMVSLGTVAGILGYYVPQLTASAGGFVLFALGLGILVKALESVEELDLKAIGKQVVALLGIIAVVAGISKLAGGGSLGSSAGLIVTILSILVLVRVLKKLAEVKFDEIKNGILPMIGLIAAISTICVALSLAGDNAKQAGLAIILISVGMLLLAEVVKQLGAMPFAEGLKGVGAVIAICFGLRIICNSLSDISPSAKQAGIAILFISASMLLLVEVIRLLGALDADSLKKGGIAVGAILALFSLLIYSTKSATNASGTIIAMAVAIGVLAASIGLLASFSNPDDVLKIGLMLAGALLAIAGAAFVMSKIPLTGIMSIVGAFLALGAAAAGIAWLVVALSNLSPETDKLSSSVEHFLSNFKVFVDGFVGMINIVLEGLSGTIGTILDFVGNILMGIAQKIGEWIPALLETASLVLEALVTFLVDNAELLVQAGTTLLDLFLSVIENSINKIVETGMHLLLGLIRGIRDNIQKIVESAVDIIINFIKGIASKIDDVIDAGFDLLDAFIKGIEHGINDRMPNLIRDFIGLGGELIAGIAKGLLGGVGKAISAIGSVCTSILNKAKSIFDSHSPSKEFEKIGRWNDEGLAQGLLKYSRYAEKAASNVGENTMDSLRDSLSNIAEAIDSDIDFSPTITPVLDLSEIQNGAKSINGIIDTNAQLSFGASANLRAISSGFNAIQTQPVTPPQNVTNNYGQIITHDQLAMAVKEALNGAGVFMDGDRVGTLLTIQQKRAAMALGN